VPVEAKPLFRPDVVRPHVFVTRLGYAGPASGALTLPGVQSSSYGPPEQQPTLGKRRKRLTEARRIEHAVITA
jgi:hypothetical protein